MTDAELLQRYQELGLRLIYWKRHGNDPKDWKGPRDVGWNDPARPYPIEKFDSSSMNIGTITGHEVAPDKFLADVDLDWADGIGLAKLLPSTGFGFGRKGKKLSHAFFTIPERIDLVAYDDIGDDGTSDGTRFVELRCGNSTSQTMIAPSLHSPGTFIELVINGQILHVSVKQLREAVLDFAIGCLLLKRIPGGLHHDGRKALAGFLLRASLTPDRVIAIIEEVCKAQVSRGVPDMSSKDIADAALVVRSTLKRIESGKKFEGGPTLAEFIGGTIGKAVLTRLNLWLGKADDFIRDSNGRIVPKNQENIRRAIEQLGHVLSYDEFADKLMIDGKPMEDRETNGILTRIEIDFRFQPPEQYFERIVKFLAWQRPSHPVKDYLASLKWDGISRIDRWLIDAAEVKDSPYARAVSAIMLIAAVRRIKKPGTKYDEMVVWESSMQGTDKSSAAQALCPRHEWFSDDLPLNLKSQQLIESTLGKWIIEASDLAGKRKTEIEQLKAMLSRQVDGPARMAYAHFPVERPRHFIIVGTTNSTAYLTDPTGARRFWPLAVKRFHVKWILEHRDQLWAEACVREEAGESIRLSEELWPEATEHQEARREIDPWEGVLRNALLFVEMSSDGKRRVTTDSLWDALGIATDKRDRYGSLRITDIMQRLGFKRTRVRPKGGEVQGGFVQWDVDKLALVDDGEELSLEREELSLGREVGADDVPF